MIATSRILDAISFAARVHDGRRRPHDEKTPYHAHPMRVAWLVASWGCDDEDTLIAALLHDVIENTVTDYDDIADKFGTTVADRVALLSRDYRLPHAKQTDVYYEALAKADWRVRIIKLADGYDNVSDVGPEKIKTAQKTLDLLGHGEEPPMVAARAALAKLVGA